MAKTLGLSRPPEMTHPAHSLKVLPVSLEVDELPVEGPGEGDVEGRVAGHLAGQHDALTNDDLHVIGPQGDPGGFWPDHSTGGRGVLI